MEETELKFINPYKLFCGAFIPNWLLERKEISQGAKLTYAKLCQYSGKDGVCFPKQEKIAKDIGVKRRQAMDYIKELKDYQLIIIIRIGYKCSNRYKFPYHSWMGDVQGTAHHNIPKTAHHNIPKIAHHSYTQNCTSIEIESKEESIRESKDIKDMSQVKTCDPVAINLSKFLLNEILKNNPSSRLHNLSAAMQETTITRWARDMDLLIRKDRQEPSTVEEVIRYCTADGFWGANILSGKKLREKWDTLTAQLKRPKNQRKEVSDDARLAHLQKVFGGDTKAGNGVQGSGP